MLKIVSMALLLFFGSLLMAKEIDLNKQHGTDQSALSAVSPEPASVLYDPSLKLSVSFNQEIDAHFLNDYSISVRFIGCDEEALSDSQSNLEAQLKQCEATFASNKHLQNMCKRCSKKTDTFFQHLHQCTPRLVKGDVALSDSKTVTFAPSEALEYGYYQVNVQLIKLAKWSVTKPISYRFKVEKNRVESLTLIPEHVELNESNTTTLHVNATYKDGSTKTLDTNLSWSIADESIAIIENNTTLKGLKEGETLIQATYDDVSSPMVSVIVYKEINGHRLPPEPDEALNNATLLGIDSNNNGVRDDVERYIILRFAQEEYPKTRTALALQYAWAEQKVIESPTRDSAQYVDDALDCESYWFSQVQKPQDQRIAELLKTNPLEAYRLGAEQTGWELEYGVFDNEEIHDAIYNTKERTKQQFIFNGAMSGGFYHGRRSALEHCHVNIDQLGE